jgi:hypothetical protein
MRAFAGIAAGACASTSKARLQRIAGQNGGGFVEGAMTGGAATTQVVIIHGRQIVVHQAVDMNELDRGGGGVEQLQ